MRFSPLLVTRLVVEPLRYFFTHYAKNANLIWDEDEKKRTIDIGTVNDYNTIALETRPRVLVGRSTFQIDKTGLSDNMAESLSIGQLKGKSDRTNLVFIRGTIQIIVEAREEGTCELLTDMVSHFIIWTRPLLCDTQGFKEFGMPMQVSDCSPDKEVTEKFKTVIDIPYIMEEDWRVSQDALLIKDFLIELAEI